MTVNVPCVGDDLSLTYADFIRKYFDNAIVIEQLMITEDTTFKDGFIIMNVIDYTQEFQELIKTQYPEYLLV
jgi:hypothetical protein